MDKNKSDGKSKFTVRLPSTIVARYEKLAEIMPRAYPGTRASITSVMETVLAGEPLDSIEQRVATRISEMKKER